MQAPGHREPRQLRRRRLAEGSSGKIKGRGDGKGDAALARDVGKALSLIHI